MLNSRNVQWSLLAGLVAGLLYALAAELTVELFAGIERPVWWELSHSREWSVLSWLQVTHIFAVLIAAVPIAAAIVRLPLERPITTSFLAAAIGLSVALYMLVLLLQSPVGELLDLSSPTLWAILALDHLKLFAALPVLVWLFSRSPSNISFKADGPDGPPL